MHLGNEDINLECILDDIETHQHFYYYKDTYWKSTVDSMIIGMLLPEISNCSLYLKAKKKMKSLISRSSIILVNNMGKNQKNTKISKFRSNFV